MTVSCAHLSIFVDIQDSCIAPLNMFSPKQQAIAYHEMIQQISLWFYPPAYLLWRWCDVNKGAKSTRMVCLLRNLSSWQVSFLFLSLDVRFFRVCLSSAPKRFEHEVPLLFISAPNQWETQPRRHCDLEITTTRVFLPVCLSSTTIWANLCWTWRECGVTQFCCFCFQDGACLCERERVLRVKRRQGGGDRKNVFACASSVSVLLSLFLFSLFLSLSLFPSLPLACTLFLPSSPLHTFSGWIFLVCIYVRVCLCVFVSPFSLSLSISVSICVFVSVCHEASVCLYMHKITYSCTISYKDE